MRGNKYIPSVAQVRDFWASDGKRQPAAKSYDEAASAAEFDRMIAGVERAAAVKALREAARLARAYKSHPKALDAADHIASILDERADRIESGEQA